MGNSATTGGVATDFSWKDVDSVILWGEFGQTPLTSDVEITSEKDTQFVTNKFALSDQELLEVGQSRRSRTPLLDARAENTKFRVTNWGISNLLIQLG